MSSLDSFRKKLSEKHKDKMSFFQPMSESAFFKDSKEFVNEVPILNLPFTGSLRRGYKAGLCMIAGPSKHFKSLLSLVTLKAYMDTYDEARMVFFDCEFGSSLSYFKSVGIDPEKVLHVPVTSIEEFRHYALTLLDGIELGDKVCMYVDSIGNMASRKEVQDAIDDKTAADMTRAKVIKSAFRGITPLLNLHHIPMVVINHVYDEMSGGPYAKTVVSGGQGIYLSSNEVFTMGRRQRKDTTTNEITGYDFILNVDKSRGCREKTKCVLEIDYKKGMNKYSGLFEIAESVGWVVAPKQGWYSRVINGVREEKSWRKKDMSTDAFWNDILACDAFHEAVEREYSTAGGSITGESLNDVPNDLESLD